VTKYDLAIDCQLGEGAYGQVFRALNRETGEFMAVKVMKVDLAAHGWAKKLKMLGKVYEEQEISLLKRFDHPCIVKYLGCNKEMEADICNVQIFMEYMPGGSLSSLLKQYGPLEEVVIKKYTRQILRGLQYLHGHGVVHRDLKGGNILVEPSSAVKIADFGASKHIRGLPVLSSNSELCTSIKGSLYWMAPEILKREGHGRKVDVWSIGCVLLEMATASHPWPDVTNYHTLCIEIAKGHTPPVPSSLSPECQDFIRLCLHHDKRERPNAAQLMKHPFLV
jgi:serine/threonine protein kinase